MPIAVRFFRFSLKSLLLLTTLVACLTFYGKYLHGYHFTPQEVEVGTFHSLFISNGTKRKLDSRIHLCTHWPDIAENHIASIGRGLRNKIQITIRAVTFTKDCDHYQASLSKAIQACINDELGQVNGKDLVVDVVFSNFYTGPKLPGHRRDLSQLVKLRYPDAVLKDEAVKR